MNINQIVEQLNSNFEFPFQKIVINDGVSGEGVYIAISLQRKEEWSWNIFENSECIKALVLPNKHRSDDDYSFEVLYNYTGTKLRNKNKGTAVQIYNHIFKQLSKLEGGENL